MADNPATLDLENWLKNVRDIPNKLVSGFNAATTPPDPGGDEAARRYMDAASPAAQGAAEAKKQAAAEAFRKMHKGRLQRPPVTAAQ